MIINNLFYIDALSCIMLALSAIVGTSVYLFAKRYLQGDSKYSSFLKMLVTLVLIIMLMTIADNVILFFILFLASNLLLVRLMVHKSTWPQALASGKLAQRNFLCGAFAFGYGFALLTLSTGKISIQSIIHSNNNTGEFTLGLLLIIVGAMTQSAIWPFHRWLASSLNSPTPASAIMHAGIVNGGGFILARFAPLYISHSYLLIMIFIIGITTAILGNIWKLMQHDVKRMLAYSTMGQMGFMFVQCGLGLFPLAVSHLCWHGMFKSYLFLASNSAAKEKPFITNRISRFKFLLALMIALSGTAVFSFVAYKNFLVLDSTLFIKIIVFIATTQLALTVLEQAPKLKISMSIVAVIITSGAYAILVKTTDLILVGLNIFQPQSWNIYYLIGIIALTVGWLIALWLSTKPKLKLPRWALCIYVTLLNKSQPHPKTVTAHRNDYNYGQQ